MAPDRVARWLQEAGVAFEILEHAPVRTSEEAARVRGTLLSQGAKALVVRADERFVHCVLPADRKHFRYKGSLTTPPCSEGVLWTVFKDPIEASSDQIRKFAELFPVNARPVQPLNWRSVQVSR